MAVALHQEIELARLESSVRQRPNGRRVLRQLRELFYLDGRLPSSLLKAAEFPLITAVLVGGMLMAAIITTSMPPAQGAVTEQAAATVSPPPTWNAQAEAHQSWLRRGHAALAGLEADELQAPPF